MITQYGESYLFIEKMKTKEIVYECVDNTKKYMQSIKKNLNEFIGKEVKNES
jgi:archaellum component FlaD/FlaE